MMEPITAPRYLIHKACAHPVIICWIIGTLLGWIAISFDLERKGVFQILQDSWTLIPLLLLAYSAISGFVFGVLFLSWVVLPLCRRMNGAPHKVGDRVFVLSGPHSGKTGCVYDILTGQGSQPLLRVDLDESSRERFHDLFEDYALLAISRR